MIGAGPQEMVGIGRGGKLEGYKFFKSRKNVKKRVANEGGESLVSVPTRTKEPRHRRKIVK